MIKYGILITFGEYDLIATLDERRENLNANN